MTHPHTDSGVRADSGKLKLSDTMRGALNLVETWAKGSPPTFMPHVGQERTFEALERRGLVEWKSVDQGSTYNGFALTEAGRAALKAEDAA